MWRCKHPHIVAAPGATRRRPALDLSLRAAQAGSAAAAARRDAMDSWGTRGVGIPPPCAAAPFRRKSRTPSSRPASAIWRRFWAVCFWRLHVSPPHFLGRAARSVRAVACWSVALAPLRFQLWPAQSFRRCPPPSSMPGLWHRCRPYSHCCWYSSAHLAAFVVDR